MPDRKLHVVVPYFNHTNAAVNRRNLELCLRHLSMTPGCQVTLSEGIWNREAELPDFTGMVHRHLKHSYPQALWVKENLINLAVTSLGDAWEHVAWIDKDVEFTDPEWAVKSVMTLRSADLIQPWSHVDFLDPEGNRVDPGLLQHEFSCTAPADERGILSWCRAPIQPDDFCGHAGMAWAATRGFMSRIGGLYDRCVFGGADRFLTAVIKPQHHSLSQMIHEIHGSFFESQARLCSQTVCSHIDGIILHRYHGEIGKRSYRPRYAMARECAYDPERDISHAADGTLRLHNPRMEKAILSYFRQREEHLVP